MLLLLLFHDHSRSSAVSLPHHPLSFFYRHCPPHGGLKLQTKIKLNSSLGIVCGCDWKHRPRETWGLTDHFSTDKFHWRKSEKKLKQGIWSKTYGGKSCLLAPSLTNAYLVSLHSPGQAHGMVSSTVCWTLLYQLKIKIISQTCPKANLIWGSLYWEPFLRCLQAVPSWQLRLRHFS